MDKNATETYGMLQTAFGASCMNGASVFEWHKRFKEGSLPIAETLFPVTFGYSLNSEAVVMRQLRMNYREFDLEGDLLGVRHTWYLSAQSFITLLKLV